MHKLRAFQQTLTEALQKVGLAEHTKGTFTPHITLLYDNKALPAIAIEPIAWMAGEFVLVHSLIGQTVHIRLGSWPLRD